MPLSTKFPQTSSPLLVEYIRMLAAQGLTPGQVQYVLANTTLNDLLNFQYGYKPAQPTLISLFSSLFLHSGFMHLFGNMLFLYIYGDNVEHQLGRMKFLLMYLLTGVAATLCFAFFAGSSMTPLVGASGAISGVLGFYFFMFPKNKVKVLIFLFPIFIGVVRIPARIVLGIYVLLDNLLPFVLQSGGNVAYGAHLGGFFAGLAIAVFGEYRGWRSPLKKDIRPAFMSPQEKNSPAMSGFEKEQNAIIRSARSGDIDALLESLKNARADDLGRLDYDDIVRIVRLLEESDHAKPAHRFLRVALAMHKNSSLTPGLYYELGRLRLNQGYATAAYQHLLTALDLQPDPHTEKKVRALLNRIGN